MRSYSPHVLFPRLRPAGLIVVVVAVHWLSLGSCAKIVAPSGGPEDKDAPTILSSEPQSLQTGIPAGDRFTAYFSEDIRTQGIEQQVFISPRPTREPEIKVKGGRLTVVFPDSFAVNQTYVVTLGSLISDLRGNSLGSSASFAFTRGDFIDTGSVSGVVTAGDAPASGIGVALYRRFTPQRLGDLDSLYPDYFTLSGSDGAFELGFLPIDDYFILAFDDADRNEWFTYGSERFGVTSLSVRLSERRFDNLELRIQNIDTSQASILGVTTSPDGLVRVNLLGSVLPQDVAAHLSSIELHSLSDSSLRMSPAALIDPLGNARSKLTLYFEDLPSDSFALKIDFREFYADRRAADTQSFAPYIFSPGPDQNSPKITFAAPVRPLAPGESVHWKLTASEPISLFSSSEPDVLSVSYSDGTELDYSFEQLTPFSYQINAQTAPLPGATYILNLAQSLVVDLAGNTADDSLKIPEISVWPADSMGGVTFSVENRHSPEYDGDYLITFDRLEGDEYRSSKSITDSVTVELPAGSYILQVAQDSDTLTPGVLFDGTLYPLRLAEPRTFYPDTIEVRPRFVTSGISVIIE
ncbi:MAG: Ig-like domain-containing protein [candidate division Zixibacteria bacterium]|nr:Ig-like domain-containing protein [candidate division Zixibacteria bacterium]